MSGTKAEAKRALELLPPREQSAVFVELNGLPGVLDAVTLVLETAPQSELRDWVCAIRKKAEEALE